MPPQNKKPTATADEPPYVSTLVPTPQEANSRRSQERAVAANTRGNERADWLRSMREPKAPWEGFTGGGPDPNDPKYAIGAQQRLATDAMHQQGLAASAPFANRSRIVIEPPNRGVIRPEDSMGLVPPIQQTGGKPVGSFQEGGTAPGPAPDIGVGNTPAAPVPLTQGPLASGGGPAQPAKSKFSLKFSPGKGDDSKLKQMEANVAAPLNRTFDEGLSFHEGGLVPQTQPYKLHRGEEIGHELVPETGVYPLEAGATVFPKKVVDKYRRKGPERE